MELEKFQYDLPKRILKVAIFHTEGSITIRRTAQNTAQTSFRFRYIRKIYFFPIVSIFLKSTIENIKGDDIFFNGN